MMFSQTIWEKDGLVDKYCLDGWLTLWQVMEDGSLFILCIKINFI